MITDQHQIYVPLSFTPSNGRCLMTPRPLASLGFLAAGSAAPSPSSPFPASSSSPPPSASSSSALSSNGCALASQFSVACVQPRHRRTDQTPNPDSKHEEQRVNKFDSPTFVLIMMQFRTSASGDASVASNAGICEPCLAFSALLIVRKSAWFLPAYMCATALLNFASFALRRCVWRTRDSLAFFLRRTRT